MDPQNLEYHDSSPPPQACDSTVNEYEAYARASNQPQSAFSQVGHTHPRPSPLGQTYHNHPSSSQNVEDVSQLHPLVCISDLIPGVPRPHLVRADERARQKKDQGGSNEWETCTQDEWNQGGRELANRMLHLTERMINVME